MKKPVTITSVESNLKNTIMFLKGSDPFFASLMDYTKEEPTITSVILALKRLGYEIVFE